MNVLYLDGVGPFGGASRSLFEAIRSLRDRGVHAHFVAARGTALDLYRTVAADAVDTTGLTRFDNTHYSQYRGIRWLILLREVFHFPHTLLALWRAKRRWADIDLIHVNEITELIPGLVAKAWFGVPLIVHVRSAQSRRPTWRTRWIARSLQRHADAIIAIDETVRSTLPPELPVDVIQNSFTAKPAARPDDGLLQRLQALRPGSLKVGFVGNLHVSKGIFDLVEAAGLLRQEGCNVEFVIVGGHTRPGRGLKGWLLRRAGLAQDVHAELLERIARAGVADSFHLLGATQDIQRAYEHMDVIAFPSHFDAPGRPIFEAAFSAVPCITCITTPTPDTLRPGETGMVVPARSPRALAAAIRFCEENRGEVQRMGLNAQALAQQNFDPATNAGRLAAIYQRVSQAHLSGRGAAQPR
jgi:glycosyltransferase involved in cell wall biosynthesis